MRTRFAVRELGGCSMIEVDRMMVRYRSIRPDDGTLREGLKALAQERRRFGYRCLHMLLRREGYAVNHKRLFRLYREERLMVRRRGGRKRALGTRAPMMLPDGPNVRWPLDFVHDQLGDGRASASSPSSMTVPANAWPSSPTPRSRASGSHASSTG